MEESAELFEGLLRLDNQDYVKGLSRCVELCQVSI